MHILFLTLVEFNNPIGTGIYPDLLKALVKRGHEVTVLCPNERRNNSRAISFQEAGIRVVQVKSLNLQKANVLEKGLATISIQRLFIRKLKTHCKNDVFHLVLYSTPPITFGPVVSYVKKKCGAVSYLLLKDIFPQNAVDLSLIRDDGFLHRWFKRIEKGLYDVSDYIGCMSPANYNYIEKHYPDLKGKLEVNPNSVDVSNVKAENNNLSFIESYVPENSRLIVYGGNLGKPQAIHLLLKSIKQSCKDNNVYFIIAGSGTDASLVEDFFKKHPDCGEYITWLKPENFERLVKRADMCLVHLSDKFTIPNFPSRILTYMACKKPIFAAVDNATDLPDLLEKERFGVSCLSSDTEGFVDIIRRLCSGEFDLEKMGLSGYDYLLKHYDVRISARLITDKLKRTDKVIVD